MLGAAEEVVVLVVVALVETAILMVLQGRPTRVAAAAEQVVVPAEGRTLDVPAGPA
jgi:hypothetical protein